ncbi:TolC family protein [Candidatus Thioglobus sp.]|uniref:TolC family protein n=1 Tax=Candidatus Thioglobus sp. TaxID=2026721 RepID=UPI003D09A7BA
MKIILTLSMSLLISANAAAITQSEFVERLKNSHPFFTQQGFDAQTDQLDYVASTANRDWLLNASINSANRLNTSNTQSANATISATRSLVATGADVTISNAWNEGVIDDKFSINYAQPLLKGVNGVNDQLNSDLSKINIDIGALKIMQSEEQFILIQLFKLIDLSYAQQQLILTTRRLALSAKELTLVKDKFEQSVVDEVEVFLQEDTYQRALQNQLRAEQALDLLKQELAVTLKLPSKAIQTDFDLYQLYQSNLTNLPEQLQNDTTQMNIIKLEQVFLQRQLLSDKNNTQAQLDLNLGASHSDDSDWSIGLYLSYPLGDTKAKSDLEKTKIKLSKAKEGAAEQLMALTIDARVANKKIVHLGKLLKSYQARIKIAKSRAMAEKKRYELGNSQLSFVISAQNNVHDVNLEYAQAAVNYQKSVLDFKATIDQLL